MCNNKIYEFEIHYVRLNMKTRGMELCGMLSRDFSTFFQNSTTTFGTFDLDGLRRHLLYNIFPEECQSTLNVLRIFHTKCFFQIVVDSVTKRNEMFGRNA
uniref:Uncharacterized protein n=1 Tax=Cacopsylla melanoneura TaxID=428564 RepID=A0A8D8X8W0_9HEMI